MMTELPGVWNFGCTLAAALKKKSIAGHGIGNARASEDGAVERGENGNQHGDGNGGGGSVAVEMGHHVGGQALGAWRLPQG